MPLFSVLITLAFKEVLDAMRISLQIFTTNCHVVFYKTVYLQA